MKLIVQIPAYNEESTIAQTLRDIPKKIDGISSVESLVIDDGSTDNTADAARKAGATHVLQLKTHRGLSAAFAAGIDAALRLGANIIVNHSASPWTWQKNNKRHRVVKAMMQGIPAEIRPALFVYCNRVGIEQQSKNFFVYDGSSAIYNSDGDLIFEAEAYRTGTVNFSIPKNPAPIKAQFPEDTKALDDALRCFLSLF